MFFHMYYANVCAQSNRHPTGSCTCVCHGWLRLHAQGVRVRAVIDWRDLLGRLRYHACRRIASVLWQCAYRQWLVDFWRCCAVPKHRRAARPTTDFTSKSSTCPSVSAAARQRSCQREPGIKYRRLRESRWSLQASHETRERRTLWVYQGPSKLK